MKRATLLVIPLLIGFSLLPWSANGATSKAKKSSPKKTSVKSKVTKSKIRQWEEEAWSGSPKKKKPSPQVSKNLKVKQELPTVQWSKPTGKGITKPETPKPAETAQKPEEPKAPPTASAGLDPATGDPEKIEEQAMKKRFKDPKGALADLQAMMDRNPNDPLWYKYSADVYMTMYDLVERQPNADLLMKIKYAGLAAQALEKGQSRKPVNPALIQRYKALEDRWINLWIETEIRKALAGQSPQ